jgi:hypothetical protein
MCSIASQHLLLGARHVAEDFRRGGLVNRKRHSTLKPTSARRPHRRIATKGQLGSSPLHDVPHRATKYPTPRLRANAGRCTIPLPPLEPALR